MQTNTKYNREKETEIHPQANTAVISAEESPKTYVQQKGWKCDVKRDACKVLKSRYQRKYNDAADSTCIP